MNPWWQEQPWRMIQTNLRETDWTDIRADVYVQQLRAFHATVAMISVGGIQANYDTKVEDHPVNPYLHGDRLQSILDACHEAGIRVIARVDYSKILRPVYEKHPDWAYRTKDGEIIDYNGAVHACICGNFQQQKAFEITAEIVTRFPVDGLFINMGGFTVSDYSYHYYGPCHCSRCREMFFKEYGLPIPDRDDMQDPIYRKYVRFKNDVMARYRRRMTEYIHTIAPNVAVEGTDFIRIESNTEYGRMPWLYDSASIVRGVQSLPPHLPCSNPTADFIGYSFRHVAVSPHQQAVRMWQTLANGGKLDYYIMGRLDNHEDRSGYEAVRRAFEFHARHHEVLDGLQLCAETLLIRTGGYSKSAEGCGWVSACAQAHIPLHEAEPGQITDASLLQPYRVVILADVEMPPESLIDALDEYVAKGGRLIVTGCSGRYTSSGEPASFLPFAGLRTTPIRYIRDDMRSAMFKIRKEDREYFPLMPESDLFFIGDTLLFADYPTEAKRVLHLIPPHRYGPPEYCYYTQVTDLPGVVKVCYGDGYTLHVPWRAGTLYTQEGYDNTFAFLQGILTRLAGVRTMEDPQAPISRMVEITCARTQKGQFLVQMINDSGHFGRSFCEPVPIQNITVRLPEIRNVIGAQDIESGEEINFEATTNSTFLHIRTLEQYKAVLLKTERGATQ